MNCSDYFILSRLSYTEELQCTILEVKAIGGFGTTIDVCLVNGRLKFGQTIVLPGTEGPIVTTVRVSTGELLPGNVFITIKYIRRC